MSGKYGIMAEANGTMVIERDYSYPPAFYVPLYNLISATMGTSNVPHELDGKSFLFNTTKAGSILWYGGTSYFPGNYSDTIQFTPPTRIVWKLVSY